MLPALQKSQHLTAPQPPGFPDRFLRLRAGPSPDYHHVGSGGQWPWRTVGPNEVATTNTNQQQARRNETFYKQFELPLMQRPRREAYGEEISQHFSVAAEELAQDISRLRLTRTNRFLDLARGPGGC